MRMLSGVETPDAGSRREGHQVVRQYFAQDEASRLDPAPTVYETLASGSPEHMIPAIRNILGGFLFSGDDVYKRVAVLSGGERTRLAVARMLLRPSNTLLLDEPTNHLDLDSKEVLLDALVDYGGSLIFVSHDRYFVDRLATKVIEIGHGEAAVYPGAYEEFLWRKEHAGDTAEPTKVPAVARPVRTPAAPGNGGAAGREARKRSDAGARKRERAVRQLQSRIDELEARIAEREAAIREIEASMAAPGFYDDRESAQPLIDRHHALMWEVGDLMQQWEELQHRASDAEPSQV
jgi:ATP-binding cassette subfamily F protein 3